MERPGAEAVVLGTRFNCRSLSSMTAETALSMVARDGEFAVADDEAVDTWTPGWLGMVDVGIEVGVVVVVVDIADAR